jgi:hypothetical protein
MRLVVLGRILRTNGRKAVCSVDKHEFRTQARNLQVMPAARTDAMLQRWADTARKGGIPKAKIAGA